MNSVSVSTTSIKHADVATALPEHLLSLVVILTDQRGQVRVEAQCSRILDAQVLALEVRERLTLLGWDCDLGGVADTAVILYAAPVAVVQAVAA
jgi:hypothetical protein